MNSGLTELEMGAVLELIQLGGGGFPVLWVDYPAEKDGSILMSCWDGDVDRSNELSNCSVCLQHWTGISFGKGDLHRTDRICSHALHSIPMFQKQSTKLSEHICEEMDKFVRVIVWGSTQDKRKLHCVRSCLL
ncbi:RING/U-box superfamily protein [Striga asiatica]|uniref:RING/U-box superfamily protein n=1 Tax=Striga asiatica TaxID=4170 RepID=A0A5A7P1K9_STRAF|nr:RING/U-box superfamily protein [Striga asiatica]